MQVRSRSVKPAGLIQFVVLEEGFAELLHHEIRDDEGVLVLTRLGCSLEDLVEEAGP
jgi:hypothetical protein